MTTPIIAILRGLTPPEAAPVARALVEADAENIAEMRDNPGLIGLAMASATAFRRRRAWIAIVVMASAVLLSATDIMPIGIAAFIGVAVVLLTRCIDASEAWGSIDGDVLILGSIGAVLRKEGRLEEALAVLDRVVAAEPRHSAAWLEQLKAYLDENFRFTVDFLRAQLPGSVCRVPEATYLAWVDMNGCLPDVDDLPMFFANEAGVLLEGGDALFVGNAKGFVRLNLAMPRAVIKKGLERMRDAVARHNNGRLPRA